MPAVPNVADSGCKTRLLRHLDQCIAEIETEICPITTSTSSENSQSSVVVDENIKNGTLASKKADNASNHNANDEKIRWVHLEKAFEKKNTDEIHFCLFAVMMTSTWI